MPHHIHEAGTEHPVLGQVGSHVHIGGRFVVFVLEFVGEVARNGLGFAGFAETVVGRFGIFFHYVLLGAGHGLFHTHDHGVAFVGDHHDHFLVEVHDRGTHHSLAHVHPATGVGLALCIEPVHAAGFGFAFFVGRVDLHGNSQVVGITISGVGLPSEHSGHRVRRFVLRPFLHVAVIVVFLFFLLLKKTFYAVEHAIYGLIDPLIDATVGPGFGSVFRPFGLFLAVFFGFGLCYRADAH